MIEITFLSKDTIGIIDTSVYQVDHARCITIYFVGKLVGSVFPRSCDLCPVSSLLGTDHFTGKGGG